MSDFGQQLFSSQGGSYLLESRLQNIRGRLSAINTSVRNLESNMIFLLVNPERVTYTSEDSGSSEQHTGDLSDSSSGDTQSSVVVSTPRTDFGQEWFTTNPYELNDQLSKSVTVRHSLMISENEILAAIDEQKKKNHHDSASADLAHHYSNNDEHPLL